VGVQKAKYTVTVVDEFNGVHDGIRWMPQYINSKGGGQFHMPEVNTLVYLMFISTSTVPIIIGGYLAPQELDAGNDDEEPNDFRQNRPVLNEGDQLLSSQDGNFFILRRGGTLEIGASQTAQRIYVPLENLIYDICQNYKMLHTGGTQTWLSRREDDQHGTEQVPVEFRMQVKEFAEDAPIIDIGLGRIAEEDAETLPFGLKGAVVARILINDRFRLWVDRDGNVSQYVHGGRTQSFNGPTADYHHESHSMRVRALLRKKLGGRYVETMSDVLEVTRDRRVTVGGNLVEEISGSVTRRSSSLDEEIEGTTSRTVGPIEETVNGNHTSNVAGTRHTGTGENHLAAVSGVHTVEVTNKDGEDYGLDIKVLDGKARIYTQKDSVEISVGPTLDSLLSSVSINLDGSVVITGGAGATTVTLNQSGLQVSTSGGDITIDSAGNVGLGPSTARGGVVTTMTHPVDFVTGAPILGSVQVSAGGSPAPTAVPPVFT